MEGGEHCRCCRRISRIDEPRCRSSFPSPRHGRYVDWSRWRFCSRARSAEPSISSPAHVRTNVIDQDEFRSVLGRFASGVTVVTSMNAEGEDQGMTVSAFCSLSLDPPLVLFCIDRAASMYSSLADAPGFIINILSEKQEALARRFSGLDPNRFDGIGYTRGLNGIVILG